MAKRLAVAAVLFAFGVVGGVVGCGSPAASSTGSGTTRPNDNKTDINIRTPKASIDIDSKDGGGTKIDIQRKGTGK